MFTSLLSSLSNAIRPSTPRNPTSPKISVATDIYTSPNRNNIDPEDVELPLSITVADRIVSPIVSRVLSSSISSITSDASLAQALVDYRSAREILTNENCNPFDADLFGAIQTKHFSTEQWADLHNLLISRASIHHKRPFSKSGTTAISQILKGKFSSIFFSQTE